MTMHEEWTDRLSDYLDGELSADDQRAVESHLRECAQCTAVLNDLKRVVARARAAGDAARPPQADLWPAVAERIDGGRRAGAGGPAGRLGSVTAFHARASRRIAFTLPQLAAAAIVVAAVSGGLVWQVAQPAGRPEGLHSNSPEPGANPRSGRDSSSADLQVRPDDVRIETVGLADAQYDAAVVDLENALKTGRGRLDSSTIAIVEHNLQIIDQAINQAREALVGDPANTYLSSHLVETRRRKLDLLRRATALTTDMN
jgi:hypothetical protein